MSEQSSNLAGKAALGRMVLAARHEPLAWTPTRAASVLGRVRQEQASRTSRKMKAIVGLSLVAAAALFCARAAAGAGDGLHDAAAEGTIAASHEALGLGDAGLLSD